MAQPSDKPRTAGLRERRRFQAQQPAERQSAESLESVAGDIGGGHRGGAVAALRASTSSQNSPEAARAFQVHARPGTTHSQMGPGDATCGEEWSTVPIVELSPAWTWQAQRRVESVAAFQLCSLFADAPCLSRQETA